MKTHQIIRIVTLCVLLASCLTRVNCQTIRAPKGETLELDDMPRISETFSRNESNKARYDYYWKLRDGTIAVNRGVRGHRDAGYVFSSLFDQTSGDCDTEVWQDGKRYRNLCLGRAGGKGIEFISDHGGVVAFWRN